MAQVTGADERHLDTCGEIDPDRRRAIYAAVRVVEGSFVKPQANVRRHGDVAVLTGVLRRQFPGRVFRQLRDVEGQDVDLDVAR
jgi:hypothetical protein